MKKYFLLFFACCALFMASCSDDFKPEESFIKIFDQPTGNVAYYPIDIKQTSDGGYLILAAKGTWEIYVMKADKEGNFVSETNVPDPYVNPVGELIEQGGNYYFFCMDRVGLFTYLMQVDAGAGVTQVQSYPGIVYPLSAYKASDGAVLLQNYNRNAYRSGFHKLGGDFSVQASQEFNIFESVEEEVVGHITHSGKRFPCFSGETSTSYFFNSFYNYSFSIVFINKSAFDFTGVYNGSNYNGALSSILETGNGLVTTRFAFGVNYLNLNTSLSTSTIGFVEDLGGTGISELREDAPVQSMQMTIGTKQITLVLSDTKTNKLVLFMYDPAGQLVGKKYLGNTNPNYVGCMVSTSDGGLAITARILLNGSFPRLALYKLSDEELKELIGEPV